MKRISHLPAMIPLLLGVSTWLAACGGDDSNPFGAAGTSGGGSGASAGAGGASGEGGTTSGTGGGAGAAGSPSCIGGCDDGFSCTVDTCAAGKCQHTIGPDSGSTACPDGQYCTLEKGCVGSPACATDAQCDELFKNDHCKVDVRCEPQSSVCVFNTLDKDKDGHAPQVCGGDDCDDSTAARHPGLSEACDGKDNDCNGTVDDAAVCPAMHACVAGACQCLPANTCGGDCVDLKTSTAHCGTCATSCVFGAVCDQGSCACPSGEAECPFGCVDLSKTPSACGSCDTPCPQGAACEQGVCTCPAGQSVCSDACVDTSLSPDHCGQCAHACPSGATCQSGACECPGGTKACGGACIDISYDPVNCGGCNSVCPLGASCNGGACECPSGSVVCGGACEDLQTSNSNCGSCGHACSAGWQCSAGACVNPNCALGQSTTTQALQTSVGDGIQVVVQVLATTKKLLVYSNKSKGTCQWGVFVRGMSDSYGLMVTAYGDNATTDPDGGSSQCPLGTDVIPDGVTPGDKLTVTGKTTHYLPASCTGVGAQVTVQACQIDAVGFGPPPTPILVADPALLMTANPLYQGNLVQISNISAEDWPDAGTVGPYGVIKLAGTGLEVHDKFYYTAQGAPSFGPSQHFNKIVGISHLDYCTWALQPVNKCTDFDPKSTDCP